MKLKFVEFNVVGQDVSGNRKMTKMLINPWQVCMVVPITIPGMLNGPDGEPMGKAVAGLDFGDGQVIAVDCNVKDTITKLENAKAVNEEDQKGDPECQSRILQ